MIVEHQSDAAALIARSDKYLNTGSGEYASEIMRDMAEFIRRGEPRAAWAPIETAPKDKDATFLVCAVGDDRRPFIIRADILWQARKAGTPSHLSLSYLTHWQPLPASPVSRPPHSSPFLGVGEGK